MNTTGLSSPVSLGEPAPGFALPAVDGSGVVSLADYRGRNAVFLVLLIGLWCPFCRRTIAKLGETEGRLEQLGVKTLGVVATQPENAQLYFKFRPSRLRLASDPELSTHRLYGVPKPAATPEFMKALETTRINPSGELPGPLPIMEAAMAVGKLDGYADNETDRADMQRQWPQLRGQFLIDRDGTIRWINIECANEGVAGVGKFPDANTIVAAARTLPQG